MLEFLEDRDQAQRETRLHRAREASNWTSQNRIAAATTLGAFLAAFFAGYTFIEAKSQASAAWEAAIQARREADASEKSYMA